MGVAFRVRSMGIAIASNGGRFGRPRGLLQTLVNVCLTGALAGQGSAPAGIDGA